ncbi:MAG: serine hydrolase, partial [bacterium]|nr:serine hydrolase [bacterium]
GMTRTTSSYDEYVSLPNHAVGHERVNGTWRVTPEQFDDDAATAAGGVASSVNDMAKWEAMVLGGGTSDGKQLIKSGALRQALFPHNLSTPLPPNADRPAGQYGYGFGIAANGLGHTVISHSGAFAQGAASFVGMIPASKLGIVVLTNGYPVGLAEAIGMTFLDNAEFGAPTQDWGSIYSQAFAGIIQTVGSLTGASRPSDVTPAKALASYAGTYANSYFGNATVTQRNGRLTLSMGPKGQRQWKLDHWNGDTFVFKVGLAEVDPSSLSAVVFNKQGTAMRIEYFDANGVGTFQRVL